MGRLSYSIFKIRKFIKPFGGAQIWAKVVSDANGGAHKIYNATVHCLNLKSMGKKFIVGDTGAGYAGKMLSMAAKKFGLKCKIFMGAKILKDKVLIVRCNEKKFCRNCSCLYRKSNTC